MSVFTNQLMNSGFVPAEDKEEGDGDEEDDEEGGGGGGAVNGKEENDIKQVTNQLIAQFPVLGNFIGQNNDAENLMKVISENPELGGLIAGGLGVGGLMNLLNNPESAKDINLENILEEGGIERFLEQQQQQKQQQGVGGGGQSGGGLNDLMNNPLVNNLLKGNGNLDEINPMDLLNLNVNLQDNLLKFQQSMELLRLESELKGRLDKWEKKQEKDQGKKRKKTRSFYDINVSEFPGLVELVNKFLMVKENKLNEEVWKERNELLCGDEHYDQLHHKKAASLLKDGFTKAVKIPKLDISFHQPENDKIFELKTELFKKRVAIERQLKDLIMKLYEYLRRPGLVTSSCVCADQVVPLSIVLNIWENGQLGLLEECYGCIFPSKDRKVIYQKLDELIEEIDIELCWKKHIENIIDKLNEYSSSRHELEKKAIIESIYHLFHEKLCYQSNVQLAAEQQQQEQQQEGVVGSGEGGGNIKIGNRGAMGVGGGGGVGGVVQGSHGKRRKVRKNKTTNRKILSISRMNGFLVRSKQIEIANVLLSNPNQGIQAALGLGKSSVIVPLLTSGLANGCHCIFIMCPLTDKPETLQRSESFRVILNHPLLVFHFENDGTHLQSKNINPDDDLSAQSSSNSTENSTEAQSKSHEQNKKNLFPPYRLDSVIHVKELYYDLLRITLEKGLVISTRESLLFFVDNYEQLWLKRSKAEEMNNLEDIKHYDELLIWYSKFFPFFKNHCRALLDEIDVILKANVKVNIALSEMAKINRDTLQLAIDCVSILLNPNESIKMKREIEEKEGNNNNKGKGKGKGKEKEKEKEKGNGKEDIIMKVPLPQAISIMSNCQAATNVHVKHEIRRKLAKKIGQRNFRFKKGEEDYEGYLSYVLCNNDKQRTSMFYEKYIKSGSKSYSANIVRLRELLGGSFATVFKRHNYSLGRMFTNDNRDDVGPYSAANTPLKNSHLSSEYDWTWALAVNYAMQGITLGQFNRFINQIRTEALNNGDKKLDNFAEFKYHKLEKQKGSFFFFFLSRLSL